MFRLTFTNTLEMNLCFGHRTVHHIASEICGVRIADDNDENKDLREDDTLQIWASLFAKTTSLARPISNEKVSPSSLSQFELKFYILSNLLDICVNHPNLDRRRQYIGRILKLSKGVQKRLMAMIELRFKGKDQTASSSKTPPQSARSQVKSIMRKPSTAKHDSMQGRDNEHGYESNLPQPSANVTTPPRNPAASNQKTQMDSGSNVSSPTPTRSHSVAFDEGSPTGYTPASKRPILRNSDAAFLSPGTMDSPQAIKAIVASLQQKNKELSHDLGLAQRRELEFKTKMDVLKQNHRKDMIRLESASMEREQELRREMEAENKHLENQLRILQEQVTKGRKAQEELSKARDELDVMGRQQNELVEMAEKVRKYKEKVSELHDVKENLKREQDAHAKAVDEIVNLENEVKILHPAKRQLEEYKIRAVEAEVKLVECQDYLRRLEQRAQRADQASDSLMKETVMQKEQMDELVRRIQKDTEESMRAAGKSVADGVSELNPEIQKELIRLRNENLQLRAFAAKRQDDAVDSLEAQLDDSERLANKYKDQYLKTKDTLQTTQAELKGSEENVRSLKSEVQNVLRQLGEYQEKVNLLENEQDGLREDLDGMRKAHDSLNNENMDLCDEIQSLQKKLKENFEMGTERLAHLQRVTEELGQTSKKLENEQARTRELEASADTWKANATEMESQYEAIQKQLAYTKSELESAREDLERVQEDMQDLSDQVLKLEKTKEQLEEQLEEERCSSSQALEATKEILETKYNQELTEQSKNMNKLLEDERKAVRLAREECNNEIQRLKEEKRLTEEDLLQKLKSAEKELDETIVQMRDESRAEAARIRDECQTEIEKATKRARKEGDKKVNDIVKKGQGMMRDLKDKTQKEFEVLHDEKCELEREKAAKEQEYAEFKITTENREAELRQQLDSSIAKINEVSREYDDAEERLRTLQRDFRRLQEENELYRRQVGGRYGGDGKLQSQYDNLQKEFNTLFEENKQLKLHNRNPSQDGFGSISEQGLLDAPYYGRGSQNRQSVPHVVREYEELLSSLKDEKRELIMKSAAAVADVEKAEKRAWEREEENEKLKAELTSLKLALQRAELSKEESGAKNSELQSPTQASFYSAQEDEDDRAQESRMESPARNRFSGSYLNSSMARTSPVIERAKREKAQQEQNLRSSLSNFRSWSDSPSKPVLNHSFSTSPPRPSQIMKASPARRPGPGVSQLVDSYESPDDSSNVLSPTGKHNQSVPAPYNFTEDLDASNHHQSGPESSSKVPPSRELPSGLKTSAPSSSRTFVDDIMNENRDLTSAEHDGQSECKQS